MTAAGALPRATRAQSLTRARRGTWRAWLYAGPPLAVLGAFVIWPVIFLVFLSLQRWDGLGPM
ncbi:MAG: hypothetical protein QOD78_1018, partial [Chloroflexota bacterium]|nr:hypothetical protein [Chloroflexota bacterium]